MSHLSISTYPMITEELLMISNRLSAVVLTTPVISPRQPCGGGQYVFKGANAGKKVLVGESVSSWCTASAMVLRIHSAPHILQK